MEIDLKPIGTVRSAIKERDRRDAKDAVAEIVLDPALTEALDNLDEFSHIIVIYYMHKSRKPAPVKVRPRYRTDARRRFCQPVAGPPQPFRKNRCKIA